MEINLFVLILKELLLLKKKVAIPGFGVFISETAPSFLSSDGLTIYPPGKRIYFRYDISTGDDGELLSYYAERENIPKADAGENLSAVISSVRDFLMKNRKYEFPHFGTMKAGGDSDVIFIMDRELDVFAEDFSLQPINLKQKSKNNIVFMSDQDISDFIKIEDDEDLEAGTAEIHTETTGEGDGSPVMEQDNVNKGQEASDEVADDVVTNQECMVETTAEPEKETAETMENGKKPDVRTKVLIAVLVVAVLAVIVFFSVVVFMGNPAMDKLLYSPEELEIINQTR